MSLFLNTGKKAFAILCMLISFISCSNISKNGPDVSEQKTNNRVKKNIDDTVGYKYKCKLLSVLSLDSLELGYDSLQFRVLFPESLTQECLFLLKKLQK